jgi:acetylornithine deacetylase/succinyl-diaminopimelate desuccinylase-like protein
MRGRAVPCPHGDLLEGTLMVAADEVREWLDQRRDDLVAELIGWVRIRSVMGLSEREVELRRSAQWLAGTLREVGFPTVEVWPTAGGPAVFAEWPVPDAPTALVYGHHDVRAAKDETWEQTPPFEPTLREGRLFGRGTSDAKGQVLAHLWALRAWLAAGHDAPPVSLKVLVEGEEEKGSPHLAELLTERSDRIGADLVVFSDTMLWAAGAPAVCTGIRGILQAELEVMGPLTDIHAGAVGGVAPSPILELARLLDDLHDEDGRVALPGFYDSVREPSAEDRARLRELPWDEQTWLDRTRTRSVGGERGWSPAERLYLRPLAEVTAVAGGDTDGPSRGAIPSLATASLQLALVPDQDPAEVADQLRRWVAGRISDSVAWTLSVSEEVAQPAYVTPPDHPALPLLADAMSEAFGVRAGWMRNAGSGPAVLLAERVGAPVLFFGTGLPEDRWHDSDESVRVDVLLAGATTLCLFWSALAAQETGQLRREAGRRRTPRSAAASSR